MASDWEAIKGDAIGGAEGAWGVVKGGGRAGREIYYTTYDLTLATEVGLYNQFSDNEIVIDHVGFKGGIGNATKARLMGGGSAAGTAAKNMGDLATGVGGFFTGYTLTSEMALAYVDYNDGVISYEEMVYNTGGAAGGQAFWTAAGGVRGPKASVSAKTPARAMPRPRSGIKVKPKASPKAPLEVHKNSLDYVGETHVYAIKSPYGVYKIGESAQGTRVRDGASIRAEAQVRALTKETGVIFYSEILRTFPNKRAARAYETKLIETHRKIHGQDSLPGNKTNR